MPKISLQFLTKTGAYCRDAPKIIESDYVPRVGELIQDKHEFNEEPYNFIVLAVIHKVTEDGKLMPHITAQRHLYGDRLAELQRLGWIPGGDTNLSQRAHDEHYE